MSVSKWINELSYF